MPVHRVQQLLRKVLPVRGRLPEALPGLPLPRPLQHRCVPLLRRQPRVRPRSVHNLRGLGAGARQGGPGRVQLPQPVHPASPAQAPAAGAVGRCWLGHLHPRPHLQGRIYQRVLRGNYLAGRGRAARQSLRQAHVQFLVQPEPGSDAVPSYVLATPPAPLPSSRSNALAAPRVLGRPVAQFGGSHPVASDRLRCGRDAKRKQDSLRQSRQRSQLWCSRYVNGTSGAARQQAAAADVVTPCSSSRNNGLATCLPAQS